MPTLRRFLTIVVMVYLLLALVFISLPGSRDAMMGMLGGERADFWFTMTVIGTVLLLLTLVVENAHGVTLRRDVTRHEGKINELKAKLYDQQLDQRDTGIRTSGSTVPRPEPVPTPVPQPAPNSIPRQPFTAPPSDELPNPTVPPPSAADLPPTSAPPTSPDLR